ncbi:hypothetical protein A6A04_03285 [Paramagnetospirillum marisnigri]|uniref:Uncharacterized protein n=1 Tax=Paramagnetospirillum marisnigri TaxID=1285242 RepID=A0A178MKS1_9PROT|nr:hypothetical protein [Paramagnetospirillum marisnigri]OAN49153.1 hypothetical protein A6A04_03285 [Paramagnetospirillum marisnigri]
MTPKLSPDRLLLAGAVVVAGLMAAQILGSPAALIFDEILHFPGVALFQSLGPGEDFLRRLPTAVGPLYALIHWAALPLTAGTAPGVRLINPLLAGLMLLALAHILKRRNQPPLAVVMALAVPTVWVVTGMALTEIPAMLFVALGMAALTDEANRDRAAILSGLAFGLAALGRQPYVAMVPLVAGIFLVLGGWGWRQVVLHLACGLPLPVMEMAIWKGFMPPGEGLTWDGFTPPAERRADAFNLRSMALSLGYCGAFMLLMAPGLMRPGRAVLMAAVAVFAANATTGFLHAVPMTSALQSLLPDSVIGLLAVAASSLIAVLAWLFAAATMSWLWRRRRDAFDVVVGLAALGIAIHPGVIALSFTSRYTMMALPFLVIMAASAMPATPWRLARLGIGAALGAVMLNSYYTTWAALLSQGLHGGGLR